MPTSSVNNAILKIFRCTERVSTESEKEQPRQRQRKRQRERQKERERQRDRERRRFAIMTNIDIASPP